MFSKLAIRTKIVTVVSALLVALIGSGLLGLQQMSSINSDAQELRTVWLASIRALGDIRASAITYRVVIRDYVSASDDEGRATAEKTLGTVGQGLDKAIAKYEPLITSTEERAIYDDFRTQWNAYVEATKGLMAVARSAKGTEARDMNAASVNPIGLKADAALRKDIELNDRGADAAGQSAIDNYAAAFKIVLGILALVGIFGAGIAYYLVRDVSRGIASIVAPMKALSGGDLGAEVPHQSEKTEIGQMADTLQIFKDALIAKKAADDAAAMESDAKIRRAQRVDEITKDFESMVGELVGSLSSASTELEAAAGTLTSTAEVTQQLSGSAASASQDVSNNVQSVAVASEEITSSVNEISRQVQESSRVAQDAVKQAEKTNSSINELSQAAARIGDVVKLITAIAEQTNLLALNATIEAARAGEAGRGFAVVASEVKALAAQTAKATEEIGAQIAGMQAATDASVSTIEEISATINLISEISATIAAAVEEQGAATQEISRNVQQAAAMSSQVASNVTEVNRGAGETGSASTQVLASAKSLSQESGQLKIEVDKFLATVRAA
jgi:methyl-accepting chemotaxis protein